MKSLAKIPILLATLIFVTSSYSAPLYEDIADGVPKIEEALSMFRAKLVKDWMYKNYKDVLYNHGGPVIERKHAQEGKFYNEKGLEDVSETIGVKTPTSRQTKNSKDGEESELFITGMTENNPAFGTTENYSETFSEVSDIRTDANIKDQSSIQSFNETPGHLTEGHHKKSVIIFRVFIHRNNDNSEDLNERPNANVKAKFSILSSEKNEESQRDDFHKVFIRISSYDRSDGKINSVFEQAKNSNESKILLHFFMFNTWELKNDGKTFSENIDPRTLLEKLSSILLDRKYKYAGMFEIENTVKINRTDGSDNDRKRNSAKNESEHLRAVRGLFDRNLTHIDKMSSILNMGKHEQNEGLMANIKNSSFFKNGSMSVTGNGTDYEEAAPTENVHDSKDDSATGKVHINDGKRSSAEDKSEHGLHIRSLFDGILPYGHKISPHLNMGKHNSSFEERVPIFKIFKPSSLFRSGNVPEKEVPGTVHVPENKEAPTTVSHNKEIPVRENSEGLKQGNETLSGVKNVSGDMDGGNIADTFVGLGMPGNADRQNRKDEQLNVNQPTSVNVSRNSAAPQIYRNVPDENETSESDNDRKKDENNSNAANYSTAVSTDVDAPNSNKNSESGSSDRQKRPEDNRRDTRNSTSAQLYRNVPDNNSTSKLEGHGGQDKGEKHHNTTSHSDATSPDANDPNRNETFKSGSSDVHKQMEGNGPDTRNSTSDQLYRNVPDNNSTSKLEGDGGQEKGKKHHNTTSHSAAISPDANQKQREHKYDVINSTSGPLNRAEPEVNETSKAETNVGQKKGESHQKATSHSASVWSVGSVPDDNKTSVTANGKVQEHDAKKDELPSAGNTFRKLPEILLPPRISFSK